MLLERGAHTETADAIGHTAASWAAKMGQKHIAPLEEMQEKKWCDVEIYLHADASDGFS